MPAPAGDAVVIAEAPSGRVLFSTSYPEQVVGRSLSELADRFEMFHPDGRLYAPAEWQLARSIAGEIVVSDEFFRVGADGARSAYSCSSYPVYDGEGRVVAAVAHSSHVTARRRIGEQLAYHATLIDNIEDAVVGTDADFRLTVWSRGAERLYGFTAEEVLGRDAREVAADEGDESRRSLEAELAANGRVRTEITAHRKNGGVVAVELIAAAIHDEAGRISGYLGIHRDVTEKKRTEEEFARRAQQQGLVAELGLWSLSQKDLQAVMDKAVRSVADGLGFEPIGIAEIAADAPEMTLRAGVGWREGAVGRGRGLPGPGSLIRYTLASGEPVVSEDVSADPRFRISPFLAQNNPVSAATVVIAGRQRPFGVLGAFSRERRSFSSDDVSFLQSVANVVSAAVDHLEVEERMVDVRDDERRRIARDLHDEALQDLTDALVQAGAGARTGDALEASRRLASVVPVLERAGRHLRGAIYDLRLGAERTRPFGDLLAELVAVQQAIASDCRVELTEQRGLPRRPLEELGTEVLRVAGEAIVNARRHASATAIRVRAWCADGRLSVEISDDGGGFEVGAEPQPYSKGLKGMRERANLLGGELTISSEAGRGTTVRLTVGLTADMAGELDGAGEPVRVLLVEDHPGVRDAMADMLGEAGFEVVSRAGSVAEARQMLDGIDIAVIDLQLPDGYGPDLIRELQQVNPKAQAVALSASPDPSDMAHALASGAAAAASKTALGDILSAVRRLGRQATAR